MKKITQVVRWPAEGTKKGSKPGSSIVLTRTGVTFRIHCLEPIGEDYMGVSTRYLYRGRLGAILATLLVPFTGHVTSQGLSNWIVMLVVVVALPIGA